MTLERREVKMEGKIIGTCGHEITDLENSTIIVKEQGVDYDGFYNAISYLSVCPKCIKNYEDIILHNQKEIDEWLNSSPCVPVPETELREQVAREIAIIRGLIQWELLPEKQTKQCGCASKESCYRDADKLIALIRSQVYKELGEWLEKKASLGTS